MVDCNPGGNDVAGDVVDENNKKEANTNENEEQLLEVQNDASDTIVVDELNAEEDTIPANSEKKE